MQLLTAAFGHTQKLLSGREGRVRWRRLWLLAAMAGIAGAGAPPPPLGLLPVAAADPALRGQVLGNPVVAGGLVSLALCLLLMGGVGRAFTFAFLEGLLTGTPRSADFRRYLRAGALHFAGTTALSAPLYALLFAGEAWVAHDVTARLTALVVDPAATPEALLGLLGLGLLKFLLVLVPWTLLTLPLMVFQYELVPARMVWEYESRWDGTPRGGKASNPSASPHSPPSAPGLRAAVRHVLALAVRRPGPAAGYLALRLGLQVLGHSAALLATLICLPVASVLGGPLLAAGWGVAYLLGGPATPSGIGALTVAGLLAAVTLYLLVCGALVPVAVLIHALALRAVGAAGVPAPAAPD